MVNVQISTFEASCRASDTEDTGMKIICYGDSNTWGFDPRGPFGERYDNPWPKLLGEKCRGCVLNLGENGREIPKTSVTFPEDTDVLIVMLGTNDLLQFWTPEAACEKMEKFLKSLDLPRKKILLISPPTMRMGEWVQDLELVADSVALAVGYRSLAGRLGIGFLDSGAWNIPLAYDGVHMTQEGHCVFAEKLWSFLCVIPNIES